MYPTLMRVILQGGIVCKACQKCIKQTAAASQVINDNWNKSHHNLVKCALCNEDTHCGKYKAMVFVV